MSQRDSIIALLQNHEALTQSALAEYMYRDKQHTPNIYSALKNLVKSGVVYQIGSNPAFYSLNSTAEIQPAVNASKKKKEYRDVSGDIISNDTLDEVSALVRNTDNYGPENEMITRCLRKFPKNTDPDIVALKIGLIDITNSTHLSQHKSRISMAELSHIIAEIPNIDARIAAGDPEIVNLIAKSNGNINLFSFATKFCCYHNHNLYGQDDYSILDKILKDYLPLYFHDVTTWKIQTWQRTYNYQAYNNYITRKLDELEITVPYRKRKFDHFVWYKNR